MALPLYLAMTAAEMSACGAFPDRVAWMACHFSCYSTGLSNCPDRLPAGSMLILNDRTPVQGHDPRAVAAQLRQVAERTGVEAVLLDLQRPGCVETEQIVRQILDNLSCPVGITEHYAASFPCPVFLSPPPLRQPLAEYLAPWKGRELWLEAALTCETVTVTREGSQCSAASDPGALSGCHAEPRLCCRYHIAVTDNQAEFTLFRDEDCLAQLLEQAQALSVTRAVGLYQQLGNKK